MQRPETVYETTNRVMDAHESKPYPFAGILQPSRVWRRLDYTATALLITAALYLGWEVLK